MNKVDAYSVLTRISEEHGVNIDKYIIEMAPSDKVPKSVIDFINEYESTHTEFLESMGSKKFYWTISNSSNIVEQAKGLSSLITHVLIEVSMNQESKSKLVRSLKLDEVLDSIKGYLVNDNEKGIEDSIERIKSMIRKGDQ